GFLLVKGAPRLVAAAGLLQLDVAGNDGDDVGPLQDLFNLALRNQQEPSPRTVPVRRRAGLSNPGALRVGIQVALESWALTSSEMALPSAFPCTLGIRAFITAPMSLRPLAPTAAIAAPTSSASWSIERWAGRCAWCRPIALSSLSDSSGRPPARNCSTESRRCLISVAIT